MQRKRTWWLGIALAACFAAVAPSALAQEDELGAKSDTLADQRNKPHRRFNNYKLTDKKRPSVFDVDRDEDRPRSDIGIPLVSFILPGFDQWWEGQTDAAVLYTGVAAGGLIYSSNIANANQKKPKKEDASARTDTEDDDDKEDEPVDQKDNTARKVQLGLLAYQGAGGISAYHSFRTAVRTRQHHDQYDFLTEEETPLDLLAAPFHFEYLTRTTTLIPLGIIAALSYLTISSEPADDLERDAFTSSDAFFAGTFSYNAGTHEEAMFRGWIMPVMREYWESDFWSNAAQSVLFAAAHLNTNPQPIPQLLLGYHLGYVTQKNNWTLGEAIFIHTWWDVVAFSTIYHYKQAEPENEAVQRLKPVLWLPPLQFAF